MNDTTDPRTDRKTEESEGSHGYKLTSFLPWPSFFGFPASHFSFVAVDRMSRQAAGNNISCWRRKDSSPKVLQNTSSIEGGQVSRMSTARQMSSSCRLPRAVCLTQYDRPCLPRQREHSTAPGTWSEPDTSVTKIFRRPGAGRSCRRQGHTAKPPVASAKELRTGVRKPVERMLYAWKSVLRQSLDTSAFQGGNSPLAEREKTSSWS